MPEVSIWNIFHHSEFGGGYSKNCGFSPSLETFADIAEWFHVEIQRKNAENGFEAIQQVGGPLNCNFSTLNHTMR